MDHGIQTSIERKKETTSLESPVREGEGIALGEIVEDPKSLNFLEDLQKSSLYNTILEFLPDRDSALLNLWIASSEKGIEGQERKKFVAENFNKLYPEQPLAENTVEQFIIRYIRPKVLKFLYNIEGEKVEKIPENEADVLRKRIEDLDKIIKEKTQPRPTETPAIKVPEEISSEDIESEKLLQESLKRQEEQAAPIYRINPQTGERTRISSKKVLINQIRLLSMFLRKLSKENSNGLHK